jgi:3-oxoacid CoA-transferase subunit A
MSDIEFQGVSGRRGCACDGVVKDGMTLMCGGFGVCGIPENLIDACTPRGCAISRWCPTMPASTASGLGLLLQSRQIAK